MKRLAILAVFGILVGGPGLSGCSLLFGSDPPQLFDLSPKSTFDENLPKADWQLVVEEPTAPKAIDTDKIAIRPATLVFEYYPGVKWTDRAPAVVQTLMVESFENSGKIVGVGRRAIGLTGDYILTSELREFEAISEADGTTDVLVRIVLKLVRQSSGGIVAATTASEQIKAASDKPADVVVAFDTALGKVLKRSVSWVLVEGAADRKRFHAE